MPLGGSMRCVSSSDRSEVQRVGRPCGAGNGFGFWNALRSAHVLDEQTPTSCAKLNCPSHSLRVTTRESGIRLLMELDPGGVGV